MKTPLSPHVVRVDPVQLDPAEDDLPPHEDLQEVLPVRPGPDGRGPVRVVIREDELRRLGVIHGGAAGDAGSAERQHGGAVWGADRELDSRERAALLCVGRPVVEVRVPAEDVAHHHAVHITLPLLHISIRVHREGEVEADDVWEHDPVIKHNVWSTPGVYNNLTIRNIYVVSSLSLSDPPASLPCSPLSQRCS